MVFEITQAQKDQLDKWLPAQRELAIRLQMEDLPANSTMRSQYEFSWELGYPYCGAIGGELTYSFNPTAIGVITTVIHSVTKQKLDLTDYDTW